MDFEPLRSFRKLLSEMPQVEVADNRVVSEGGRSGDEYSTPLDNQKGALVKINTNHDVDDVFEALGSPLPVPSTTGMTIDFILKTTNSTDEDSPGDSTETSCSAPDAPIVVARAQHRLIASLMREVYSMFGTKWTDNVRAHAGHRSDSSFTGSQQKNTSSQKQEAKKRRGQERDSTPPGHSSGEGRKRRCTEEPAQGPGLLFACPFNKYDPEKYCPSSYDGAKFRSCIGPGFPTISRLKQHLKRTHSAPIQCPRCWTTMPDQQALARHLNEESRCERTDPQPEGIDENKMLLITSNRGATWDEIYEILFPGAPIPKPYYVTQSPPRERATTVSASPASQEIADFETYSSRALPLLVEANLQALVSAEMAPLEDSLRTLLVDIVRRCQSTVAQNFQRLQGAKPGVGSASSLTPDALPCGPPQPAKINQALLHYQEPPFQATDVAVSNTIPLIPHERTPFSDSGYGSGVNQVWCDCPCHFDNIGSHLIPDIQNCLDCEPKHFDSYLNAGDLEGRSRNT